MNTIRKISIGSDYTKGMHYSLGQSVIDKSYLIHDIIESNESFDIYIEKDKEIYKWKNLSKNLPYIVEYNIDF